MPVYRQTNLVQHAAIAPGQVERQLDEATLLDFASVEDGSRRIILRYGTGRSELNLCGDNAQMLLAVKGSFGDDDFRPAGGDVAAKVVSVSKHVVMRMLGVGLAFGIDRGLYDDFVLRGREREQIAVDGKSLVAPSRHDSEFISTRILRQLVGFAGVGDADV